MLPGLSTVLHLQLEHASKHQLFSRCFNGIRSETAIKVFTENCAQFNLFKYLI